MSRKPTIKNSHMVSRRTLDNSTFSPFPVNDNITEYEAIRETPHRQPNLMSDVAIPFAMASLNTLAWTVIIWITGWSPGWFTVVCSMIIFSISLIYFFHLINRTLFVRESIYQSMAEPDRAQQTGQPIQLTSMVKSETAFNQKNGFIPPEIGDRFLTWAGDVSSGKSLGVRQWAGSGKLFTADEYKLLMDEMINLNVVYKGDGSAGYAWSPTGKDQVKQWIDGS